jgi:hypothetical protein
MTPSSALLRNLRSSSSNSPSSVINPVKIGLEIGCPEGTVLIQRTSKEDLIRARYIFRRQHANDYSIKASEGYEVSNLT